MSKVITEPPKKKEKIKLGTNAGGVWELTNAWGRQILDFEHGTIDFINEARGIKEQPMDLWSCEYKHPHVSFSYGVDKGGWDHRIDFSGTLNGDSMQGFYSPGFLPVTGKRSVPNKS